MGMWIRRIIGISSKGQATSSIEKYPVSFGEKKRLVYGSCIQLFCCSCMNKVKE